MLSSAQTALKPSAIWVSVIPESTPLVVTATGTLLLVPEFFAPLRGFSAAYQDRLHATGAAEALADLPAPPEPQPLCEVRTVAAQGVTVMFENVVLTWDAERGPALNGLSFRVPATTSSLSPPMGRP